jgi:hypothetical protein
MALQEKDLVNLEGGSLPPLNTVPDQPFPGARGFEPNHIYTKGTVIFHDNLLYRVLANFKSGVEFNINDWEQIAINSVSWGDIEGEIEDQEDLQIALDEESQARQESDQEIQNSLIQTNNSLQALQDDFNSWIGRGGYLTAFDFGTATPLQEDLTNEALSQITSITDPLQIWNGTKIKNLNNGHTWILTNTQDTVPPVFEWNDQGSGDLAAFGKNMGGYVVGADPDTDGPEYVFPQLGGKGKINLDAVKQMLFDMEHPVGDVVEQMPGALSPIDKGWTGTWQMWNDRASLYRLRQTPIPGYTAYTPGANYAANAVVMWHLEGDDYAFFQAKETITGAAEQIDPVKWNQLKEGVVVERKDILDVNPWTDNDLVIGQQITGGEYDGYWVEEVIVYGGKFPSATGGNRPPFVDGGVAGDVSRPITGRTYTTYAGVGISWTSAIGSEGALKATPTQNGLSAVSFNGAGSNLGIDISAVVNVGPEFSPRTLSVLYWRRINV